MHELARNVHFDVRLKKKLLSCLMLFESHDGEQF